MLFKMENNSTEAGIENRQAPETILFSPVFVLSSEIHFSCNWNVDRQETWQMLLKSIQSSNTRFRYKKNAQALLLQLKLSSTNFLA